MSERFLKLHPTGSALSWRFPITLDVCVGPPGNIFMYGGAGLGAAIQALESATGRIVLWATAQYLSVARPGAVIDLDLTLAVQGRRTSQARVVGRIDDQDVFVVLAALGSGVEGVLQQWAEPPDMPAPLDCSPAELWAGQTDNLNGRLELRMAPGRYGQGPREGRLSPDGRLAFWIRSRQEARPDSSLLAVFADYVPAGVGVAFGREGGGNSLDNTLRFVGVPPTPWVLCDVRVSAANNGVAHGAMNLFNEDGRLLAVGSQSVIVRFL
jgi:acyl-CoA thioesterase-2